MSMEDRESACQARILVVDPEEWCRQFLSSVIKLCGYDDFRLANSVAEALAALDECSYDLVITDLRQPDYQRLLENARHRYPSTRFIVMMQRRTQTQQMFYLEQVDIVYKPLSPGRNHPQDPARPPSEAAAPGGRRAAPPETGSLAHLFELVFFQFADGSAFGAHARQLLTVGRASAPAVFYADLRPLKNRFLREGDRGT